MKSASTTIVACLLASILLTQICFLIKPQQSRRKTIADITDFGAKGDGFTDETKAIQSALHSGAQLVLVPTGTYKTTATLDIPNGVRLEGEGRAGSVIMYAGTGSALRYDSHISHANSGYANIWVAHLKITTASIENKGAALDISAGGWSYFDINDCWITGRFKFGIVLDGAEICTIRNNLIEGLADYSEANVWIVNGKEWNEALYSTGTGRGYSTTLTLQDNQFSGGKIGVRDDGGANHSLLENNFNEHDRAAWFTDVVRLTLIGNSFETTRQTTDANVRIDTQTPAGEVRTYCSGGIVHGNMFTGNMSPGGSLLKFADTAAQGNHVSFSVVGNTFESRLGRGNAIDDRYVRGSFFGQNVDNGGIIGMGHYYQTSSLGGVPDGNIRFPPRTPKYPAATMPNSLDYEFGDTSHPVRIKGGIIGTIKGDLVGTPNSAPSDLNHAPLGYSKYTSTQSNRPDDGGILFAMSSRGSNVPTSGNWIIQVAYAINGKIWSRVNIDGQAWSHWTEK